MTTTIQTPTIIVTSDRWSREPYVVFENEAMIGGAIANDWVNDRLSQMADDSSDVTLEDAENILIEEFEAENDSVDEFWPEHMICRSGDDYYRYDSDGMAKWIGNFDSIEEAIEE